ncbi:MAG: type II toxin-antitoxin system VapC family toxin [Pseudomonadota bacterium]
MTGLDTNVLIRFLAQDHPEQARAATALIESLTPDRPGYVSAVVLAEIAWVLKSSYGLDRHALADTMGAVLTASELVIENKDAALQALATFRKGRSVDFPDCLIAECARAAGCAEAYTFDRRAARQTWMTELV